MNSKYYNNKDDKISEYNEYQLLVLNQRHYVHFIILISNIYFIDTG